MRRCFHPAPSPQSVGKKEEYQGIQEGVADMIIEGTACWNDEVLHDHGALKKPGLRPRQDCPRCVGKDADPRVVHPYEGYPELHRPEGNKGEVKFRCIAPAEPGIIGHVDKDIAPVLYG